MLAPGFGSIHDWIAGGKRRKHHDQPIVLCSSHTEATSVVRGGPRKGEGGESMWGRRRCDGQGKPDNSPR
jgi:hypothetical protein